MGRRVAKREKGRMGEWWAIWEHATEHAGEEVQCTVWHPSAMPGDAMRWMVLHNSTANRLIGTIFSSLISVISVIFREFTGSRVGRRTSGPQANKKRSRRTVTRRLARYDVRLAWHWTWGWHWMSAQDFRGLSLSAAFRRQFLATVSGDRNWWRRATLRPNENVKQPVEKLDAEWLKHSALSTVQQQRPLKCVP